MKTWMLIAIGVAGLLGGYCFRPQPVQAVQQGDVDRLVDVLRETNRTLERIQRSIDDGAKECRR